MRTDHQFIEYFDDVRGWIGEDIFSKVKDNKTRLRDSLSVNILESIVKVSETFHGNFEINT